jgi:DNA-binding transcriptional ArsR family regulator
LHPVRLRIVQRMTRGGTATTSELCAWLPDISEATVYRQIGLLFDGGLLEIAGERRVHGAVERRYRLRTVRTVIDGDVAASMSLEDHRRGFAAALAALVAGFNAYLDRKDADPYADSVAYRQVPLWLSRDELAEIIRKVRRIITTKVRNTPGADRRLYLLSPILFPIDDGPKQTSVNALQVSAEQAKQRQDKPPKRQRVAKESRPS